MVALADVPVLVNLNVVSVGTWVMVFSPLNEFNLTFVKAPLNVAEPDVEFDTVNVVTVGTVLIVNVPL
jgi:Iap family predicted aminopeptidase